MIKWSRVRSTIRMVVLVGSAITTVAGLILPATVLWQRLWPSHDLVVEAVVTAAPRMAPELQKKRDELPDEISKRFIGSDDVKKLVPTESLRSRVGDTLRTILQEHRKWDDFGGGINDHLISCSIKNVGQTTLAGVQVHVRHGLLGAVLIEAPDGTRKVVETRGIVELGDLRPQTSVKVFGWVTGMVRGFPDSISASYTHGAGHVRVYETTRDFEPGSIGIYLSYRELTVYLLGLVLVLLGCVGIGIAIYRRRSWRAPERTDSTFRG